MDMIFLLNAVIWREFKGKEAASMFHGQLYQVVIHHVVVIYCIKETSDSSVWPKQ